MIISLKNGETSKWVTDTHEQIQNNLIFDGTSRGIAYNYTFVLLLPDTITLDSMNVSLDGEVFTIARADGVSGSFIETQSVTNTDIQRPDQNNTQIWQWNVMIYSNIEGIYTDVMRINYVIGGVSYDFEINLEAEILGIDTRFLVQVQNLKFQITNDYYTAFFESDYQATEEDHVLLNAKRKEYLLNYFDLNAQVGSYKTLLDALDYFGYGDLLELRELWYNEDLDTYQSTTILNEVQRNIDNRLTGYRKTNQIQLIYRLNEFDGTFDSDGLENYQTVNIDPDEYLIKMYALRRILECDFLPLNTKIVDIIGEHTSVAGVDSNHWENQYILSQSRLTEDDDTSLEFLNNQRTIQVSEHEVLLTDDRLNIIDGGDGVPSDDDTADYPAGVTSSNFYQNTDFFEVNTWLSKDEQTSLNTPDGTFQEYDYVQRYHRGDFGMLEVKVNFDATKYSRWKWEVYDVDVSEFTPIEESNLRLISTLSDRDGVFNLGIGRLGTFKIVIYLFDWYGGVSIINPNNETFTVINRKPNFLLGRLARENGTYKSLDLSSTYESTVASEDRSVVIDAIDNTLDINTFDPLTHTNTILRHYAATDVNRNPLHLSNYEFNNLPLGSLTQTNVRDYGYEYALGHFDMWGDGTAGTRTIRIRLRDHNPWEELSIDVLAVDTIEDFYRRVIDALDALATDSLFKERFTWNLSEWSLDTIANKKMILQLSAIDEGSSIDSFSQDTTTLDAFNPIVNEWNDYFTVSVLSAYLPVYVEPATGDLNVILTDVDGVEQANFTVTGLNVATPDDLVNAINTNLDLLDARDQLWVFTAGDWMRMSSINDIQISHPSIGNQKAVVRGKSSAKLEIIRAGSEFYLGQPFYAFLDLNTKLHNADLYWKLTNSLTGEVVNEQRAYVYRHIVFDQGSYNLELSATDKYGTETVIKNAFVVYQNV